MPRARIPTLTLLLAAGLSVVGPNLIEPEPVASPWSDSTTAIGPRADVHASMASGSRSPSNTENDPDERSTTCHAS